MSSAIPVFPCLHRVQLSPLEQRRLQSGTSHAVVHDRAACPAYIRQQYDVHERVTLAMIAGLERAVCTEGIHANDIGHSCIGLRVVCDVTFEKELVVVPLQACLGRKRGGERLARKRAEVQDSEPPRSVDGWLQRYLSTLDVHAQHSQHQGALPDRGSVEGRDIDT